MILIENCDIFGVESAIRGMRNPMNSWDKSDSYKLVDSDEIGSNRHEFVIGSNDLELMKSLIKAGTDHSKFMRMINITMDITAPLYWWKEYDTYKVGTVANSCSTMHKIHSKALEIEDFSCEHLCEHARNWMIQTIITLNEYREEFIETKDKKYWWQMIQLLPSSYNQKRTVQLNYQVLRNIYFSRRNHKLDEWRVFCSFIENNIPYGKELICLD